MGGGISGSKIAEASEKELRALADDFSSEQRRRVLAALGGDRDEVQACDTTLAVWVAGAFAWSFRLSTLAPKQVVRQVVAGPYTAFFLLEDGTPMRCGPTSCDDTAPLAEPQPLSHLMDACGSRITSLGINYMDLFAVTDQDDVWVDSRPGEGSSCWMSSSRFLCEESDADDWDDERPQKAVKLCGKQVVGVYGNQNYGVVQAASGEAWVFAALDFWRSESEQMDEHAHALLRLDVDGRKVQKVAVDDVGTAILLLEGGKVAAINRYSGADGDEVQRQGDTLKVQCIPDIDRIVDISSDTLWAIDDSGKLYNLDNPKQRFCVAGGGRASEFRGYALVVDDKSLHVIWRGGQLARRWADGCGRALTVASGRYYDIAVFCGGSVPEMAPSELGETGFEVGADFLAYLFDRPCDITGDETEGVNVERLERLLTSGKYDLSELPKLLDECKFYGFLEKHVNRGESGCAAAKLFIEHGLPKQVVEDAVAQCVDDGDEDLLGKLKAIGCQVTQEHECECAENKRKLAEE